MSPRNENCLIKNFDTPSLIKVQPVLSHEVTPPMKSYLLIFTSVIVASSLTAQAQNYDTNNPFVQTFVGSGFYGYLDGQGTQTMFNNPSAVVADSSSNLFVLDISNYRIRK